jgi:Glycosyltransferases involved in cell wall biogenesis
MMISCLCPTYKRPTLLANAIACFLQQDYDGPAELIVLDDAGELLPGESEPIPGRVAGL